MLGEKKEKLPFGKRPPKGSFGKKPSGGNFGKKPSSGSFGKNKTSSEKKELFNHSSIKPKTAKVSKRKIIKKKSEKNLATPEEKEFLDWLKEDFQYEKYPCFVCNNLNTNDSIEWHHVKKYSSDAKNHKRLIPLCGNEHHRLGTTLSPHGTPKKWRETYSMEEQNAYADKVWNDFQTYKKGMSV